MHDSCFYRIAKSISDKMAWRSLQLLTVMMLLLPIFCYHGTSQRDEVPHGLKHMRGGARTVGTQSKQTSSSAKQLVRQDSGLYKASKQRDRLVQNRSRLSHLLSSIKKPLQKRVTWAKDVIDNEFLGKKPSKICCQVPPSFFNRTSDPLNLDDMVSSMDSEEKMSLHDSELQNPWLSDIDRDQTWFHPGAAKTRK